MAPLGCPLGWHHLQNAFRLASQQSAPFWGTREPHTFCPIVGGAAHSSVASLPFLPASPSKLFSFYISQLASGTSPLLPKLQGRFSSASSCLDIPLGLSSVSRKLPCFFPLGSRTQHTHSSTPCLPLPLASFLDL